MNVEVRTSSGVTVIPLESTLLSARKVYLEGEITPEAACGIAKQLTYLCSKSHERIELMICSPGGDVHAGLMLYDYMQSCPAPVITVCAGYAYSMAALLFCSGISGRYMTPNSELMLHEPMLGTKIGGSASSVLSASEGLLRMKRKICAILAKHSGKTPEAIEEAIRCDRYYTAEEAVASGFADRIAGMWELEGLQ